MRIFSAIRFLPSIACLITISLASLIQAQESWRDLYQPQVFDGMPCRIMTPLTVDANKDYPVIVSLHGAGGKGNNNKKQLKDWNHQLADEQRRKDRQETSKNLQGKSTKRKTGLAQSATRGLSSREKQGGAALDTRFGISGLNKGGLAKKKGTKKKSK